MIRLVTFHDDRMERSARLCVSSAERFGTDEEFIWTPEAIKETKFYKENHALLDQPRGAMGFWSWKPYIILREMGEMADGSICLYSDAGVEFIEPVQTVIDLMDQDIWLFGNEHEHAHWCKRDIVEAVWPVCVEPGRLAAPAIGYKPPFNEPPNVVSTPWSRFGKQAQASVIFFRVNDYTRAFVKEWLHWCLYGVQTYTDVDGYKIPKATHYLIDDSPSVAPNHPEFKENRHDQAILTTMAYRDGIKLHEWFVKYEGYTPGRMNGYKHELERPFVFHHRRRNAEWEGRAA